MTAPLILRGVLILLLAAALMAPEPAQEESGARVLRLSDEEASLIDHLLDADTPGLFVRAHAEPPSDAELALLGSLARRAPLLATLPEAMPPLRVQAPSDLRVGRRAALPFTLRGTPGDTLAAFLIEGGTPVDSLRIALGPRGDASGAFRLRPTSAGWREWGVEAAASAVEVGGWVEEGAAPSVLLLTGAPGWESRFLARALEESGATVTLSQTVAPGVQLGEPMPTTLQGLSSYDAVLLLPGGPLGPGRLALLGRYVAESGGGVLVAGEAGALSALGIADDAVPGSASGAALDWSVPAELEPLPAATLESSSVALEGTRPGALTIASADGQGSLAAIRALGFGRVAFVGLTETWRWRLEAGSIAEHRDFWRALVDWLVAGDPEQRSVRPAASGGVVGLPVPVEISGANGEAFPALDLIRPDGAAESLPLRPDPARPGRAVGAFLPVTAGVHELVLGEGGEARAGFRAHPAANEDEAMVVDEYAGDRWARLALLADRSGGAMTGLDSVDARADAFFAARADSGSRLPDPRSVLLALAVLVAITEWALRRVRGLA